MEGRGPFGWKCQGVRWIKGFVHFKRISRVGNATIGFYLHFNGNRIYVTICRHTTHYTVSIDIMCQYLSLNLFIPPMRNNPSGGK